MSNEHAQLTVREINGPYMQLLTNLQGPNGHEWLEALKKFLRKENPWSDQVNVFHEAFDRNGWTQEQIDVLLGGDMLTRVRTRWFSPVTLDTPIDEVFTEEAVEENGGSFSRISSCFRNENICTVRDLVKQKELELCRIPNLGRKSIETLKKVLMNHGLHLGMKEV